MGIKMIHTADWHLGTFRSPVKDGVNLRAEDTKRCLDELVRVAGEEKPDYVLVSGDIFDRAEIRQGRSHKEVLYARHVILELAKASGHVVVMRGTPNHDSAEAFEELQAHFEQTPNVHIVTSPQVVSFADVDIAVLPGFDTGVFRAKFPGLSGEEENAAFTNELSNIVLGLRAQCRPGKTSILMAHYTVPGCNTESGQEMTLTKFEPVLLPEILLAADFSLVALGHIHRPQRIGSNDWYYSGAINAMNFNDEGQERGFWIHENEYPDAPGIWKDRFCKTPYREFITFHFTDADVAAVISGNMDEVAMNHWRWNGAVADRIVRVHFSCQADKVKAYKAYDALLERTLLEDGAFMLWENLLENASDPVNRTELTGTADPEENLARYLEEKQFPPEKVQELILKARPLIAKAESGMAVAADIGIFEPVEIYVKNYRNYEEETFNFNDITFCTINGQNGAGKSSLFMDAIIDCLYEEPREKEPVGWIRNVDGEACAGAIMFTFRIGEKTYRVTRTRKRAGKDAKNKNGKITLNLAELVGGEWQNRSMEKVPDTQREIENVIGMDSFTFKSCALVMQDQYGIFLQAKPEERVEVLSTLLGLGVYREMEKAAADMRGFFSSKADSAKKEEEMHMVTAGGLGDPAGELESCEKELAVYEGSLKEKTGERDRNRLLLTNRQEAAGRRARLLASIKSLEAKKAAAGQNRDAQQSIIDASTVILDGRPDIEAKVAEYHAQADKERTLSNEAALYSVKKKEAEGLRKQEASEQAALKRMENEAAGKKAELEALQSTGHDAVIRENAAEYEKYSALIRQMQELKVKHAQAQADREKCAYGVKSKLAYISQGKERIQAKKADLERRTGLLKDSGCPDIENAGCRFLSDAMEAKKQLPEVEKEMAGFIDEQGQVLKELEKALDEAELAIEKVGFDGAKMEVCQRRVAELANAPAELKKLEERGSRIALIKAGLDNLQSNIQEAQKRLATAKLKAIETENERDRYARYFEEHSLVQAAMESLKPWLEKEKQLPVAEERKTTAMVRVQELALEMAGIDAEIAEKEAEAARESLSMAGLEELAGIVAVQDAEVASISEKVKEKQIEVGSLKQKAEQLEGLEKKIKALRKLKTEYAKEMADYGILKTAFSQGGVPHQIIRSIIPQITATSNSILGQMTGGKMGVEFRLERIQKSDGKEKGTLDIFIEEYGKTALPYLSKSGGEKVKASLSVILALAETKSSSAGIQLGMLFIDEPPFLDSDGVQAYCDALEAIRGRYGGIKIMAITHDPAMKARFPQNLDVVKTEGGSKVIY